MAVEESGHVSEKLANFSRPLSSVEDHKALKRGQWKASEDKVENLSVNGTKTNLKIERVALFLHTQIDPNFYF
jgi:hypothetical protein